MEATSIFLIWMHVTTMFGTDYFVQPTEAKYQRAFIGKDDCEASAKPLARAMKSKATPPGITFNGVVCRPIEIKR